MKRKQPSLFTRHDTFFGVCEALGQDFHFNANWLRIAFAVALLLSPIGSVAAYCGLGLVIAVSRWLCPAQRAIAPVSAKDPLRAVNDSEVQDLAAAA